MKGRLLSPPTFLRLPWVSWYAPKAMRTDMGGPTLLGFFAAAATGGSPPVEVLKPSGFETLPDGGSGLVVSDAEKQAAVQRFLDGLSAAERGAPTKRQLRDDLAVDAPAHARSCRGGKRSGVTVATPAAPVVTVKQVRTPATSRRRTHVRTVVCARCASTNTRSATARPVARWRRADASACAARPSPGR